MRIAILGNYPPHPFSDKLNCSSKPLFGVSTWLVNLVNSLSNIGHLEIHVIAETSEINEDKSICENDVTFHFVHAPNRLRSSTLYYFDCLSFRKIIAEIQPDILHAHHTGEYSWFAVNERLPAVITVHGIYRAVAKSLKAGILSHYGRLSIVERICLKKARHIISINPYVNDYISKSFLGSVYEIENPVNEIYFHCKDDTLTGVLLFVAVLSPIKNLHGLIDILAKVKEKISQVQLRVIGFYTPDLEWYRQEIDNFITKMGLRDNVLFLGHKTESEIVEELSRANCLLLTSKQETAPMVISEAMAAGKPVVAMEVGGIRHMVRDGVTGYLVPPGDPQAMADKVVRILEDATLRKTMGEAARKEALQRFHPELVARKTLAVYEEILQIEHKR
jgi:glycosyltransferase involved in cell wall biosynthesis